MTLYDTADCCMHGCYNLRMDGSYFCMGCSSQLGYVRPLEPALRQFARLR